jgi:Ca-activated chloride channel family protein
MKTTIVVLLTAVVLGLVCISSNTACALPQQSITLQSRLNTPTISSNGGTAYLQLTIATPTIALPQRHPLNLAIVLDRSGSMGDEGKIDFAKKALWKLVDQLNSEDILSIVIYDDIVDVLRTAQPVGRNKYAIKHLIDEVYPRGSTNLGGGMVEGFRQVECNLGKEFVNRVVLLSDGLANQGVTDPGALDQIARKHRAKCISLTTMGVGLDYNENLMVGLAKNGGGNYYFIESPRSLASIMSREFNMLSCVVAQNASIELTLGHNVSFRDVVGCEFHAQADRYVIPVGDLYSNENRDFTIELSVPEGSGTFTVATSTLRYESDKQWSSGFPTAYADVRYTHDVALIEKQRDLSVQAKADVAVSTRTVENAMKALDEGKDLEAASYLQQAEDALRSSPAASALGAGGAAIREQSTRLNSYKQLLKDSTGDGRKAKKSIQYDNYRTQNGK